MVTVLKVGGSVLTDKSEPETLDSESLAAVASAVGEAVETGGATDLVVVHGGGSFGHHHAAAHGLSETAGTRDADAVGAIHGAMCDLNRAVVDALRDAGAPALPVHPLSVAHRDESGSLSFPAGGMSAMLGEEFVPVSHGDVVTHVGAGATILSGDEIVISLARSLEADRVGLCSDVPGVLDGDGEVVPEVETYEAVAPALGGADGTDVTGGMAAKVERLLDLDAPASIFDRSDLAAFLRGEIPGTTIR